jgi:hypothetical protein
VRIPEVLADSFECLTRLRVPPCRYFIECTIEDVKKYLTNNILSCPQKKASKNGCKDDLALKLPGQSEMEVVLAVVFLDNPRDNAQGKTLSTSLS